MWLTGKKLLKDITNDYNDVNDFNDKLRLLLQLFLFHIFQYMPVISKIPVQTMAQGHIHYHPTDYILQFFLWLATILLLAHIFLKLQLHTGSRLGSTCTVAQAMER